MQASAQNSETVLLKALQNAKKNLLWLGILVVAINGYSLLEFGQHSRNLNSAVNSDQQARGVELQSALNNARSSDERLIIQRQIKDHAATGTVASALGHVLLACVFAFVLAYIAVGCLLIYLSFIIEKYPRAATITAFCSYVLISVVVVGLDVLCGGPYINWIFRGLVIYYLYRDMNCAIALHKLRSKSI